jgi:hypothetical protein
MTELHKDKASGRQSFKKIKLQGDKASGRFKRIKLQEEKASG